MTPRTKTRMTIPDAHASAPPAVTVIPVLPKPITKSFTMNAPPATRDGIVSYFDFPMKTSFPSRSIV